MTIDGVYGTGVDLLPRSMVRLVRTDERGGRRLAWVGRQDVELLSLEQHLRYERESLALFPRNPDGTVEWESVTDGVLSGSIHPDFAELSAVIREFTPKTDGLVFFWGSLAIPTVRMGLEVSLSHLQDITDSFPEFWVYSPRDRVVVENTFAGVVTVAAVPFGGGN